MAKVVCGADVQNQQATAGKQNVNLNNSVACICFKRTHISVLRGNITRIL